VNINVAHQSDEDKPYKKPQHNMC